MHSYNCWCGSKKLIPFSIYYSECERCHTLVSLKGLAPEKLLVKDDEEDFYGKKYWLDHQSDDLNYPDIHARAINDLTERNLHWLHTLLKYKLPPAKVLELGCSHGSFVALLSNVGYEALGLEMSPWVVDLGKKIFKIQIELGPIENLKIAAGSLDVIALFDVLEHLPDPLKTIKYCISLLSPTGFLLIQTPEFRREVNYETLFRTNSPFLQQLKADEHLYLFSRDSVSEFFKKLKIDNIYFEPAIFDFYDMFFVASKSKLRANSIKSIEKKLLSTVGGRITNALLTLRKRELSLEEKLSTSDADRANRGQQIEELNKLLKASDTDRAAQDEQIEELRINIQRLFKRPTFKFFIRFLNWPEIKYLSDKINYKK